MPYNFFQERNIPFVCFHFTLDGKTYPDDLGKSVPFDELFRRIAAGSQPTTSQVNVQEYTDFWEPFLKDGKDVLHISLSSGISGSYNSACTAASELREKYPDRKLYVVDSLCASSGYGLFMEMLADARDAGMDIDGLKDYAEEKKLTVNHWFFSSDLTSYFRGGRISRTAFFVGRLLNICPILNVSDEGKLTPRYKVRTKKKAMEALEAEMEKNASDKTEYAGNCIICESVCKEDAEMLASQIENRFQNLKGKVKIVSIGTVIGSHTGPGTIALFFTGKKRNG